MKYTKSVDIWNLGAEQVAALQVGQWVYAGTNEAMSRGRYLDGNAGYADGWLLQDLALNLRGNDEKQI
jgi:hypothetical protein